MSPAGKEEGRQERVGWGGVPGQGDGNQNHLILVVGKKKTKGERSAFQETEARFPPEGQLSVNPGRFHSVLSAPRSNEGF